MTDPSNRTAHASARFLRVLVIAAAALTMGTLLLLVGYIFIKGIAHLSPSLFSPRYNSTNVSLFPAMINTFAMTLLSLLLAVPTGIGSAVYLVEYARRGSKLVALARITTETLSGIPSIVYGLFGSLLFVTYLGWSWSILAGACTMGIMILPLVMRTTEEALKAVPDSFREGSFGLGAGRLRTTLHIVLPAAVPGIFAGVILAVGRIIGETAALIYTAGTAPQVAPSVFSSGRTLSVHMYMLWQEGFNTDQSYATAVILLLVVAAINALSSLLARKLTRG